MMATDPTRLLDQVATWCAVALVLVVTARTLVGCACTCLARLPGAAGRACDRAGTALTPLVARRMLAGLLGLGAAAVPVTSSAVAVAAHEMPDAAGDLASLPVLDRGDPTVPDLDRAVTPRTAPAPHPSTARVHVVRPGDTLWRIAARWLPAGASAVEIDREWRRWYRANRDVIGADPDLILPGQRLVPPAAGES